MKHYLRSKDIVFTLLFCVLLSMFSQTAGARLADDELKAMQMLVLGPKDNEVKFCVDSSLEILEGLVALARSPEDEVVKILTRGEMSESQRQMREQQARMWKETHAPHKLANFQYGWCMAQQGHPTLTLGELGDRCFSVSMIPAYASLLKTSNVPIESAEEKMMQSWKQQVSEDFLRKVLNAVYAAENREKKREVFRQVFIGCLGTNNAH